MPTFYVWYQRDRDPTKVNLRAPQTVRRGDYEKVVKTWSSSLENLFHQLNVMSGSQRPIELGIRDMFSGDLAEDETGKLWFCKSIGWEEVQWEQSSPAVTANTTGYYALQYPTGELVGMDVPSGYYPFKAEPRNAWLLTDATELIKYRDRFAASDNFKLVVVSMTIKEIP